MRPLLFLLSLILAASAAKSISAPRAPGRLRCDEAVQSFGLVSHGAVVRRTYRCRNDGGTRIALADVRTSCGCTAAEPTRRILGPGEAAEIAVAFDTARKGVGSGRAKFKHSIKIATRDLDIDAPTAHTTLFLEGEVLARYRLIPDVGLHFPGVNQGGDPVAATVEVLPMPEGLPGEPPPPGLELGPDGARVVSKPSGLEIHEVAPVSRDGRKGLAVKAAIRADAEVGVVDGAIRIATGNQLQPEVTIPVRGFVYPPVMPYPPRLLLARGGIGLPRSIELRAPKPPEVLHVEVISSDGSPAPIAARPERDAHGKSLITVEARSGADLGAEAGSAGDILVFLASKRCPVVAIPYHFRIVPATAEVEAQRRAGVLVSPPDLYIGDVDPDEPREFSVSVTRLGRDAQRIEPGDVRVDPPEALSVELQPVMPGQVARLVIRPTPRGPGPFGARIAFSPRPGAEPMGVRVAGRVPPRVRVEPAALVLRGDGPAEVVLRQRDGDPLRVLAAEDPSGLRELRTEPVPEGGVRLVAVRRGPASGAPPALAYIVVRTDVEGEREVRVPIIELPAE